MAEVGAEGEVVDVHVGAEKDHAAFRVEWPRRADADPMQGGDLDVGLGGRLADDPGDRREDRGPTFRRGRRGLGPAEDVIPRVHHAGQDLRPTEIHAHNQRPDPPIRHRSDSAFPRLRDFSGPIITPFPVRGASAAGMGTRARNGSHPRRETAKGAGRRAISTSGTRSDGFSPEPTGCAGLVNLEVDSHSPIMNRSVEGGDRKFRDRPGGGVIDRTGRCIVERYFVSSGLIKSIGYDLGSSNPRSRAPERLDLRLFRRALLHLHRVPGGRFQGGVLQRGDQGHLRVRGRAAHRSMTPARARGETPGPRSGGWGRVQPMRFPKSL